MKQKLIGAAVVAMLALGAGVAFAATQGTTISAVCVNDTNGLMRAADTCREGEHAATIGAAGGGNVRSTAGSFTEAWGASGDAKVLPLTGVTVSGHCDTFTLPFGTGDGANARMQLDAPSGKTMDVYPGGFNSGPTTSSILLPPASSYFGGPMKHAGTASALVSANNATATLTIGGYVDPDARTCTFLWQALEAAN